jgi:hypothetical protein
MLLFPALRLPLVRRLWEKVDNPYDSRVVCKGKEYVALRVRLLRLGDRLDRVSHVNNKHRVKECLIGLAAALDVELAELRSRRTGRDASRPNMVGQEKVHFVGNGKVWRGTKLAAVVDRVGAQEDERVWVAGCADEAVHMTPVMAWGVEKIERAVAKVVDSTESSYHERRCGEVHLSQDSASGQRSQSAIGCSRARKTWVGLLIVPFLDERVLLDWVARKKVLLESRSNHQFRGFGECRGVAKVIPVMMADRISKARKV